MANSVMPSYASPSTGRYAKVLRGGRMNHPSHLIPWKIPCSDNLSAVMMHPMTSKHKRKRSSSEDVVFRGLRSCESAQARQYLPSLSCGQPPTRVRSDTECNFALVYIYMQSLGSGINQNIWV